MHKLNKYNSEKNKIKQNKTTLVQLPHTTLGQKTRLAYSTILPSSPMSRLFHSATVAHHLVMLIRYIIVYCLNINTGTKNAVTNAAMALIAIHCVEYTIHCVQKKKHPLTFSSISP